jgi:hypothetical protein
MEITGSIRKRADAFAPEENTIKVQLEAGKGHVEVPQAELEHVGPVQEEPKGQSLGELKNQIKDSLENISGYERSITEIVEKIEKEKETISEVIKKI